MRNIIWTILFIVAIPLVLFGLAFDWVLFGTEQDRINADYNK